MTTRRLMLPVVVLAGLLVALWSSARPSAHIPIGTSVTWNRDVIGILERRCLACHRDEGPAPMSLTTYDVARPWARAIREEVLERRMPPSSLRSGAGLYENARALSLAEIELLVSWADGGAPRGTGPDPVPATLDTSHWSSHFTGELVAGDASAVVRRLAIAAPKGWIGEWTFDSGAWPIVSARLVLKDGSVLGDWTAGDPPVRYPDGTGVSIPADNALAIDVTLARPLTDDIAASARPTLHVTRAVGALRPVTVRTLQDRTAAKIGELLLAVKLDLAQPDANADLFVERKSGEEEFLMSIGPPRATDAISYRLREPLALLPGDRVKVSSDSKYTLAIESTPSVRRSSAP